MNTRAFLLASLIAGVIMGLLGGLPIISFANCLLCIWVWGSAILAVYLYRRLEGSQPMVTLSQGALLGVVSGLIGALIVWLISLLTRGAAEQFIGQIAQQAGVDVPAQFLGTGLSLFSLLFDLVLYAIFGAVGGLIGASIFKPKTPAPMPPTASQ
jgi:hypothetical protein